MKRKAIYVFFPSAPTRVVTILGSVFLLISITGLPVNGAIAHHNEIPILQDEDASAPQNHAAVARQLASPDPLERQHAAEELARLVALDQAKLVAGYRLEEKDRRVRLALDWALYRMGKKEALFSLVHDLGSSRHRQASEYLAHVDSPQVLYPFLNVGGDQTRTRLLGILGEIGDAATLEQIRVYTTSQSKNVSEAAQSATLQIEKRTSDGGVPAASRPRHVQPTPSSP